MCNVRPTYAFSKRFISLLLCYGLLLSQLSLAIPQAAARARLSAGDNGSASKFMAQAKTSASDTFKMLGVSWLNAVVGYTGSANVTTSPLPQQQSSSSSIVISQVYGGGGNSGATYKNDFIELFNRSNVIIELTNWSVQYAAAGSSTWQVTSLSGTLGPGQYLLVQEAQGAGGTMNLPTPDVTGAVSMNATAGKVALLNHTTPLTVSYPVGDPNVSDFVGYGSSANSFEGSGPAPTPSNTNAALRANNGCTDTDNNITDFNAGAPAPRNSSSNVSVCGGGLPVSLTVVISEFRTRGPGGGYDEFVELYNMTDGPLDISGWKIKASSGAGGVATRVVVNPGTTLPAHGHFLATNNTGPDGYTGAVAGDQTYTTGIPDNGGIAVVKPDDTIIDRVGMSNGSAFKESRALDTLTANSDQSYERRPGGGGGSSQDTNDNPSDFQMHAPSDPQNLYSPPTSPNNQPPVADAGGPYVASVGAPVQFNGSASHDPDGSVTSYEWSFGDGATDAGVLSSHTYASAGTYSVTLTVTDNSGTTQSSSTTVTTTSAGNQSPVANLGGPYTGSVGSDIQFNGSNSTDPDGTITSYAWDFGDMTTGTGATPSHAYEATGTYSITLIVTDNMGAAASSTVKITVGGNNENLVAAGDVGWDGGNAPSAGDFENGRGNPSNRSEGNGNFQITAPVLSLPGRGLDLNLNLYYNSRLWNKSGTEMVYDIDHDWPAPGWQLGFGKMVDMGTAGAMIIEGDGTRHGFTGTSTYTGNVLTFKGQTTDGSFIDYRSERDGLNAVARYPNGTVVYYNNHTTGFNYSTPTIYLYPTMIRDANGNFIQIKYEWDQREPRITRMVDTLGRVVDFHYNSDKLLTAVTTKGIKDSAGNVTTRTLVRLHYKRLTLGHAFAGGLSTRVANSTPWVIDAIYYPATATGYWFGDDDSYSPYGMIKKVVEQRGMGFSDSTPLTELGTVTPGLMTRQQDYSYPAAADSSLKNAPTFSTMTTTWEGINTEPAVTIFDVQNPLAPNDRTVTVTRPDGTKTIQRSYNLSNLSDSDPDKYKDGLVYEEEVDDASGRLLQKNKMFWEPGSVKSARLTRTEITDELGQMLATNYDQYGDYNAVGRVRQYDYSGNVVRTTRTTYLSYVNDLDRPIYSAFNVITPRLINLVESEKIYTGDDSANKLAFHRLNKYDEYSEQLKSYTANYTANSDLYMFGEIRNSNSGLLGHAGYFNPRAYPEGSGTDYIIRRGNLTSIVTYADPNNPSGPGNSTTRRSYDMTGNVVASSAACCEQTSLEYKLDTQYAFPASKTRGSSDQSSLLRVTTSATYDLNTGLTLTATDANGRTTRTDFYPSSLRLREIIMPTDAHTIFEYDDVAMKVTQTSYLSPGGAVAGKNIKYFNGIGQARREESLGAESTWDLVETQYDKLGRVWKQTRPFNEGMTPQWKETVYDELGRVKELREPYVSPEELAARGSVTKMVYNGARPEGASTDAGQSLQAFDAWGRWRWTRKDASGRLAEVVEPNPDGGSGFVTKYSYDVLGNLKETNQGGQIRRFRYDALGRLTHQKLAETEATLNNSGERASTEPASERWSNVFTYDERSNVTSSTDARGVRTLFSFKDASGNDDPLNRLQSITYDTARVDSSTLEVLAAAPISYEYRIKSSASQLMDVTQVKKVTASGVSTEEFTYDPATGLMKEKKLQLPGLSKTFTLTYDFDALDRLKEMTYPEQYQGIEGGTQARKVVKPGYDVAGRVSELKVDDLTYASQARYNSASQLTSMVLGNSVSESYSYNSKSGLLTSQQIRRGDTTLLGLTYGYKQTYPCVGTKCASADDSLSHPYTGQVTKVLTDGLYSSGSYTYSYDALGRLKTAEHGYGYIVETYEWRMEPDGTLVCVGGGLKEPKDTQTYSYDKFGNRTGVVATGYVMGSGQAMPLDGLGSVAYDEQSNRITTAGFNYDADGNQKQAGTGQLFIYDAAGRLVKVKDQAGATVVQYAYGSSRQRLMTQYGDQGSPRTYYVWEGGSVIAEYGATSSIPQWSKNYIYFGQRLLATQELDTSGGELVKYHHPDRVGTRLVTNNKNTDAATQETLPFGTTMGSESSGATSRRFTSYDRSSSTGLDYAVNRHYDPRQGRFTQVDPIGMQAANLTDPQSFNLYAYAGNDPINRLDPDGQFSFGSLLGFLGALFRAFLPNRVNISYTYRNLPPISVSFTPNFQNVYLGFAGVEFQVRGGAQQLSPLDAMYNAYVELTRDLLWGNISNRCREKVFGKLSKKFSDFDYGSFARFLNNSGSSGLQDGTTSLDNIAGTVTVPQVAPIMFPGATTVADAFRLNTGLHALTSIVSKFLLVFFRPSTIDMSHNGVNSRNKSLLLHEALHGYGGSLGGFSYFDTELQDAFGITVDGNNTENISKYIKDNCF